MPKKTPVWPGAERLRKLCQAVGIEGPTQLAVAIARLEGKDTPVEQLSVSSQASWWDGSRRPSVDAIESVLAVTGGSADYLITGLGEMFLTEPGAKEQAFDDMAAIVDRVRLREPARRPAQPGQPPAQAPKALPAAQKRPVKKAGHRRDPNGGRRAR